METRDSMLQHVDFHIRDGRSVSLQDPWCDGLTMANKFRHRIFRSVNLPRNANLDILMVNGSWDLNLLQGQELQQLREYLVLRPIHTSADKLLWNNGKFSYKEAWKICRFQAEEVSWYKFCWGKARPRWSVTTVFVMLNKIPFIVNLQRRKLCLVSRCSLCQSAIDTTDHIFISYRFSKDFWSWLGEILKWNMHQFAEVVSLADLFNWFQVVATVGFHKTLFPAMLWGIWKERNARLYGTATAPVIVAMLEVLDIHSILLSDLLV
ncbi:uncharacterized protein LOC132301794 [Cornus florida]|uniref:uncharacterized protein LOC132301794 n=1 Tax=Cornus florida TaxID=4283 RepID=UPI0028971D1D|nr:uncharacterized protein LOC132301794 [Cornus florida]